MNKEELVLSLIDKLLNNTSNIEVNNQIQEESIFIWKYVILRTRNAWVHFWKLVYAVNWFYRLENSRRLYYWETANKWISLSEVAEFWITNKSKICKTLSVIEIIEKEGWEIIPCSDISIKSIQEKKDYICN